jgi:hypothetical protein
MDSIRIVHVGRGSDERKHRFIRVLRSGRKMDSIRIVHVGKGSDERKRSVANALKWEKIPSEVTNRALRSGKSGRIGDRRGNKRGSHL